MAFGIVRQFALGLGLMAVASIGSWYTSGAKLEQTRARAAMANTHRATSVDDKVIVDDNIVAYTTKNQALLDARKKARDTLSRFDSLMQSGMKATFTVKFPLTQNGHTEHIWLQVDTMRNGRYAGRLANTPVNGNAYELGQPMVVASADVEDWMARTADAIYGGYTARFQMKDVPSPQKEKLMAMFRD
jgi:uncharacterized protein YegJ (DUF2314 family)